MNFSKFKRVNIESSGVDHVVDDIATAYSCYANNIMLENSCRSMVKLGFCHTIVHVDVYGLTVTLD